MQKDYFMKIKLFPSCARRKFRICAVDVNVFSEFIEKENLENLKNVKIAEHIRLHSSEGENWAEHVKSIICCQKEVYDRRKVGGSKFDDP